MDIFLPILWQSGAGAPKSGLGISLKFFRVFSRKALLAQGPAGAKHNTFALEQER